MQKMLGWLAVILFFIWSIVSWHWYTCKIKGFCGQKKVTEVPLKEKAPEIKIAKRVPQIVETKKIKVEVVEVEEVKETPKAKEECKPYLVQKIGFGRKNSTTEVKKLEQFLNNHEHESLKIDGYYSATDERAVRRFQQKYRREILAPWGLRTPTGNVFITTVSKINQLYCE